MLNPVEVLGPSCTTAILATADEDPLVVKFLLVRLQPIHNRLTFAMLQQVTSIHWLCRQI